MKYLFSFLLVVAQHSPTIAQFVLRGSFVSIGAGKDGIMVASDSRCLIEIGGKQVGYYDGITKTFPIGAVALTIMGRATIGNYPSDAFVQYFIKQNNKPVTVNTLIPSLLSFSKLVLTAQEYETFIKGCILYSTGYLKGKPSISLHDKRGYQNYSAEKSMSLSYRPCDFDKTYSSVLGCKQLGILAEKSIYTYAKQHSQENLIGGRIRILKIAPSGKMEWLQNPPTGIPAKTAMGAIRDYAAGKLKITFPSHKHKEAFDRQLKKAHPEYYR